MQYFFSVIDDTSGLVTPSEMSAIDIFNQRLIGEGHWVFAAGLAIPSTTTVIDNRAGEAIITDGPFTRSEISLDVKTLSPSPSLRPGRRLRTSATCKG